MLCSCSAEKRRDGFVKIFLESISRWLQYSLERNEKQLFIVNVLHKMLEKVGSKAGLRIWKAEIVISREKQTPGTSNYTLVWLQIGTVAILCLLFDYDGTSEGGPFRFNGDN